MSAGESCEANTYEKREKERDSSSLPLVHCDRSRYKSSTDLGLLTVKKSVPSKRAAPLVEAPPGLRDNWGYVLRRNHAQDEV